MMEMLYPFTARFATTKNSRDISNAEDYSNVAQVHPEASYFILTFRKKTRSDPSNRIEIIAQRAPICLSPETTGTFPELFVDSMPWYSYDERLSILNVTGASSMPVNSYIRTLGYMNFRLLISMVLLLVAIGCTRRAAIPRTVKAAPPPLDLTSASDSELQQRIGERITMRGRFSLRGKVGPFILVNGHPIYLVPRGHFPWGEPYASMEGLDVRVTGTLRFAHHSEPSRQALPEGRAPDHFYFEAETAKVELDER